jgi:hypothetical protein
MLRGDGGSNPVPQGQTSADLAHPRGMHSSAAYGFIEVYVTVPDFDVEPAIRIGAYPRFVVHSCALTSIVGKGKQLAYAALKTLGNCPFFH